MSDVIPPPPRTSELVVARMQESISSGRWPVGERIPSEPELVEQFGVGRNTVREAVRALEHAGMLVPRRGDGTYVRSANMLAAAIARCASERRHHELFGALQAIELEAAALAATGADPARIADLRTCLKQAEQALARGDLTAYTQADIAFHAAVVAASGNGLLVELHGGIVEAMQQMCPRLVDATAVDGEHSPGPRELVAAVAAADPAAARAAVHLCRDHVRRLLR
ncbi:FCD domain-containing protein [Gordonia sp. HNM0687]|uniref:FCD domain-containing protein n=1 Tax=Gordonia mangrovi TaxID=2665643 RepID=A0A6L7GMQ5_9ACTN|nr:FCD domain-containing protein [Gordonia mangrovi]MXP20471.1 FCD domain-containing protein [Gordonia mangrovi]UVF78933.1 FCD domain-containing protein [Gordonia mangrovi]